MSGQLLIFIIICEYSRHTPTQSQRRNVEIKLCWTLLQRCFADLGKNCRLIDDSIGQIQLIACQSACVYETYLHSNGILCATIGYRSIYRIRLKYTNIFLDRLGADKISECKWMDKNRINYCNVSVDVC